MSNVSDHIDVHFQILLPGIAICTRNLIVFWWKRSGWYSFNKLYDYPL